WPQAANHEIFGTVVDAATGQFIAAARVSAKAGGGALTVIADDQGKFRFRNIPGERIVLTAWKTGYAAADGSQSRLSESFIFAVDEESKQVTLQLVPESAVEGRALGSRGIGM